MPNYYYLFTLGHRDRTQTLNSIDRGHSENLDWLIRLDLESPDCEYDIQPNNQRFVSKIDEKLQVDLILNSDEFESEIATPYSTFLNFYNKKCFFFI